MSILDPLKAHNSPSTWWTAAVYKDVPGRGYVFQGYTSAAQQRYIDFFDFRMARYPLLQGFRTYPFWWNGESWIRHTGSSAGVGAEIVGAIERKNPLPPGRYWQDIFDKQAPAWNAWISEHAASGSVKIVNSQTFPDQKRFWVLFEVLRPTEWPAVKLGFPTIAGPEVTSSSDTVSMPTTETSAEILEKSLKKAGTFAAGALVLYLGAKLLIDR